MTPAQHDPQNDLSRTLSRQAERFAERGGSLIELDDVLDRAGEIRRARRMRASMAMAAVVLAIAAPVGIQVLGDSDPAERTPTVAADPPNNDPITIQGLKDGKSPTTGWLAGAELFGDSAPVPVGAGDPVSYLARLDGAFLVGRYEEKSQEMVAAVLGADEADGTTWPMASGFTVSEDGRTGAFVQPDGTVVTVAADGGATELGTVPGGENVGYDAIAASGDCAATCAVVVGSTAEDPKVWSIDQDGTVSELDTALQWTVDVDDSRYAGVTRTNDEDMSTCSAVTRGGAELWTTCPDGAPSGKRLDAFSPDGKHLLAIGSIGSGEGESELAILDASDGRVVLDLRTAGWGTEKQGVIRQLMWEDDSHVLALVREGEEFAVVRIGLNGAREYALPVAKGVDVDTPPFRLPVG